ncbi:PREDICTED: DNA topoisomerase 2-binding protein 1 isoform X2 [Vollenhovia emeryi]|uniref:DNA topoisomerase 2-binding protein 1 isoform X2 n=1 Tax=Vollenhovia emeryi TaxID=411798 RepID=UPI0005F4BA4F|nr:PREDICTED: DNA topoisomerase 2-binding protein 1 isoform X2 [Vollenhovia emeryi]
MDTQESQLECDVNVHFVVPSHLRSEDDCSEKMWQAFNKCSELNLCPEWVSKELCDAMEPSKKDVFVIEEFRGDLFDRLRTFKCSIVSPKCLLICFTNGEPIPEGTSPIYTTSMRGMCVTASGFSLQIKDWIQRQVEYMGGIFTKQLRGSVTHLVTDSVMSAKYEHAVEMKIPIMTKEWIEAVWEINLKEIIKADDKIFDKYKCPVFMNLVVTSTNLHKREKEEIKRSIHGHGGTFMGPLDGTKVRMVLASKTGPMSDKLKYAMENNIPCLRTEWVYESIKLGYALPFCNFIIKSVKMCSTPERSNNQELPNWGSDISSIAHDKPRSNYVNETFSSTVSNVSSVSAVTGKLSSAAKLNVLDRLTFDEAKSAGPFLDGCNIYLTGFAPNVRDKLSRILNVGGATRFDDISDAVTHVIVGDGAKASAELKMIKSSGSCPYILNVEWLEQSMKLKRPASEECYLFETKDGASKTTIETPASPLSKKNLQMLQQPTRLPVPSFKIIAPVNENEQPDLVQQYLQENNDRNNVTQEFTKPRALVSKDKNKGSLSNTTSLRTSELSSSEVTLIKNVENDNTVSLSQSCAVNEKLLKGLTFVVAGFNESEDNHIEETIAMLGGRLIQRTYSGVSNYGVVPIHGASLKQMVHEIVTDLFIEDCINQEKVVDIMYYHKPLSIRKPCTPLSGCVITMSMYTGAERIYLSTLAATLGAICQDMFARKANAEKNTHASTHLICPTPEGNKYNAAVRWKLPAVTAEWLKTCADELTLVDETPFLVGETIALDRSSISETNPSSVRENRTVQKAQEISTRNIITPKRHLSQVKDVPSAETPLINKRLSLVMNQTPPSPFHVSTPDTPYGQVFQPNPSPDTRKEWLKWVNNFPDLHIAEPPVKRRNPSTPLSDLKRQLWEKLMNADQSEKVHKSDKTPRHEVDNFTEKTEEVDNRSNKTNLSTSPINRKLDFDEKNNSIPNNEINMQIAQLDQVLQRTSSTPENRYSLSGENAKKYNETSDHIQKCIVKDSQPIDAIVWEDPDHPKRSIIGKQSSKDSNVIHEEHIEDDVTEHEECEPLSIRKFMLSGIKNNKNECESMIKDLGGDVSTNANFDNSATHLLCIKLSKNEKVLGSIAAGKWVLHCSYLHSSHQNDRFLDEEEYEWGNPKSKNTIPKSSGEIENAIAAAAHRWRLKLQKNPIGPFSNIVALLMVSEEKYDQVKRLLEAGGGSVVQARPPYDVSPSGRKITHCFVNVKQINQPVDWAMLASKGILCFPPQYLSDYLTTVKPLNPRDCVLPEFKKYLTLLPK